jgi:outer membrane receptor for ferrienterochelin and colicin
MSRLDRSRRASAIVVFLLAALAVFGARRAEAQATGTISGQVVAGKEPAEFANVIVLGTRRGAMTDENGRFTITQVPIGSHTIKVQAPGYDPKQQVVVVNAGPNSVGTINVGAQKVVKEIEEVKVTAQRMIDVKSSSTKQTVTGETLKDLPVENLQEAIGLKAGVVATGGELHVRGGRGGEIKYQVEGIEVADPLFGRGASIANLSVAGAEVLSGGFDAEFGNALSGVVNITTREGGERFGGDFQWHTDRYGENAKTFNNYDRFTIGLGGPTPIKNMTYFLTYEGVWSDTYLDAGMTRSTSAVLDFLRFGDRQSNQINTNVKLAYKPAGTQKLTFEAINNRNINTPYNHMWSRKGYVSVTYDTVTTAGGYDLRERYGVWSFFPEDSTFQYQNLADHVPTTDNKFRQLKSVWTHSLTPKDVYTVRVSRFQFNTLTTVQGREPWEFQIQPPLYWSGNQDNDLYYATHGDFPVYADQKTSTWTLKSDYTTTHWKGHTFKAGLEGVYNSVNLLSMQFPNQEAQGLPGLNRSDFTYYNPEGSAFLQDRWEYEGLVLNAGLRYDLFTPGPQIPDEDLPNGRYKQQVSPRLGIAYPISDRDVLSFHYGWTFQTPQRNFVFENRGSQSTVAVRGNPDLAPETNISYQAAVQHLFSKDVSGQFAVFFKDIFGLISVRQEVDALTGLLVPVYVNQDYASARGFEASIIKRFSHKFSTEVNYTYSIASGVASDPNTGLQFANGNLLYLPISEQALDWDQRHTLNANLILRDPGKWGVTFLWSFGSGLPYTPTFRNDRRPDPAFTNTRRLPSTSQLSIVGDKYFHIWGQNVTFFIDARNVLDQVSINNLDPSNFPNPYINQVGNDYLIYYTETGRAGGAYLKDTNGDRVEDWVSLNDPRVFSEGRNVRVGVGVTF